MICINSRQLATSRKLWLKTYWSKIKSNPATTWLKWFLASKPAAMLDWFEVWEQIKRQADTAQLSIHYNIIIYHHWFLYLILLCKGNWYFTQLLSKNKSHCIHVRPSSCSSFDLQLFFSPPTWKLYDILTASYFDTSWLITRERKQGQGGHVWGRPVFWSTTVKAMVSWGLSAHYHRPVVLH